MNKILIALITSILYLLTLINPSLILATDIIGPWILSENSLPYTVASHTSFTNSNKIGIVGGGITASTLDHYSLASLKNNGALSEWEISELSFPQRIHWHASATLNNYVFILGGTNHPPINSINKVYLGNINDGIVTSWSLLNSLPNELSLGATAIVGNKIYFGGGNKYVDQALVENSNKVYVAKINPLNGTITDWTETTSLPEPLQGFGMIGTQNKIVVIGGRHISTDRDTVWEATIKEDGTLGSWIENTTAQLPRPVYRSGIVKIGSRVISVGGIDNGTFLNNVYYSEIQADGSLGAWIESPNNFPHNWCCGSLAATNTHLYYTGGHEKSAGYFNNVYISSLNNSSQNPIILLPGYGGSYNFDALVHDSDVPDSDWKLTPFFDEKVYGGIIKTLENTSYERNENFYVYPYDWRRNAGDTANNLSDFIDTQVLTGDYENSQVNLIGHSFGGLIGRAYAQNNPNKVENLITVGSPHKGALKTYNIWEGADFSDMPFYQEIPLRGFIRTKIKDYDTKVEALQNFSPSLLNIWPTFDFLKKTGGSIKPLSSLTWQNNFLPELDGSLPDILDLLSTISGNIPSSTKRFIVVEEPSETNIRFGKWVDGKPVSVENDAGDETVLLSSSQVDGAGNHELNDLSHTKIIYKEEGLGKILEILGVEGEIETSIFEDFNKAIMAFIASPATFKVIGPSGQEFMPSDNLLIINDPQDGEYETVVTGQEEGEYTLYFGRIKGGDEAWDIIENHILEGNEDTHQFEVNLDNESLGSEPTEKIEDVIERLKTTIEKSDAGKLPQHLMIKEVEKLERIINLYSKFDKQRTTDNMIRLLNLQINFIKEGLDGWPWSTLTEDEKGEIQEGLNRILWLIEEDYSNRFE